MLLLLLLAILQTSSFGALLDVILDIVLRGWLWVNALPPCVALLPPLLEMLVFAVTHKVRKAPWQPLLAEQVTPIVGFCAPPLLTLTKESQGGQACGSCSCATVHMRPSNPSSYYIRPCISTAFIYAAKAR
jgi:hypothetical protein